MSVFVNRLNNSSINDKLPSTFVNIQGQPLLCLATLTQSIINASDPSMPGPQMSGLRYINLNQSFARNDLAFTQYGSLMSFKNWNIGGAEYLFWISPFDPQYNKNPQFPSTSGCSAVDVINGTKNGFVFNNISNGTMFVSPKNAQFILNVTQDQNQNNVYQVFFNPLQNPSLSAETIASNLPTYCSIVSNSDPMCYCDNTSQLCMSAALGGLSNVRALKEQNKAYYDEVQKNCNCLNPQCPYASRNEPNNYAKGFLKNCNTTSACGIKYTNTSSGLITSDVIGSYGSVAQQCGINSSPTPITPGPSPPGPSPPGPSPPGPSPPSPSSSDKTSSFTKIGIMITIVIIILVAYYFI